MPEDVDAVHCGPEDEPDDDPPELLDPLEELLDPLDPLEPLDPDEELEPLEDPLELVAKPPKELDPLLEPPLLPLLPLRPLLPPLLERPESVRPPSDDPEPASEPPSVLIPPSSPGLAVSDEAHAEAMPALNPTKQTTRRIRGVLVFEVTPAETLFTPSQGSCSCGLLSVRG